MWVAGIVALGAAVAMASDDRCRIEKLRAFTQDSQCITVANVQAIGRNLPVEDVQALIDQCGADLEAAYDRAEARALSSGRECPTVGDAAEVHERLLTACCPLCCE